MIGLFCFLLAVLGSPFKSKLRLEAENAVLRHQLIVSRRRLHGQVRLTNQDRWFLIRLYRWFTSILAGSHNLSGPRRSYVGTGPASAATGESERRCRFDLVASATSRGAVTLRQTLLLRQKHVVLSSSSSAPARCAGHDPSAQISLVSRRKMILLKIVI